MLLNKNNKKQYLKPQSKIVHCGEFDVRIIKLGVSGVIAIEKMNDNRKDKKDMETLIIGVVSLCCVDEDDNPIFTEDDVRNLPLEIATKLFHEAFDYNMKMEIEEKAKNS